MSAAAEPFTFDESRAIIAELGEHRSEVILISSKP
jgi:hypothetical protein